MASRYGNMTGVLMHECQGARVHEGSSHVTIPSVDAIMQEFNLRGFPLELQGMSVPTP